MKESSHPYFCRANRAAGGSAQAFWGTGEAAMAACASARAASTSRENSALSPNGFFLQIEGPWSRFGGQTDPEKHCAQALEREGGRNLTCKTLRKDLLSLARWLISATNRALQAWRSFDNEAPIRQHLAGTENLGELTVASTWVRLDKIIQI